MSNKLKEMEKKFAGIIEKLKEEKEQLLRSENSVLDHKKRKRESRDEPQTKDNISVLYDQIKLKKKVGVFTHNY